jgi:hypothetical protein
MDQSLINKATDGLGQKHSSVLSAKTSYINAFFSHKHLELFEPVSLYTAARVTFLLLSMLLSLKPVPGKLIKSEICEVYVLI